MFTSRFSVGTGQQPIVCQSAAKVCRESLEDSYGDIINAQSQLLSMLFELIVSKELSLESLECRDLEHWRDQNHCIIGMFSDYLGCMAGANITLRPESDATMGLKFAYSSAHLMFCRHLLKVLTNSSPVLSHLKLSSANIELRMNSLIDIVIQHSFVIMELYLTIAASEGNVTPAFNHMMCTSAAITVVEFKSRLKHAKEVLVLMKRLHRSIEHIGRNDKVIGWATNVMEIAAGEELIVV